MRPLRPPKPGDFYRLELHYTPEHASWLNMVEIEIGVLHGRCLDRRIDDPDCSAAKSRLGTTTERRDARINWNHNRTKLAQNCSRLSPPSRLTIVYFLNRLLGSTKGFLPASIICFVYE